MKRIVLCLMMLSCFNISSMMRRPAASPYRHANNIERRQLRLPHYRPGIITLKRKQVEIFKNLRGEDLKDDSMQRLMLATVKLGILENSLLYNAYCKKFEDGESYSMNVLANARFKFVKSIEQTDGIVDLALVEKRFDAEFIRALPKRIECGNLPDRETAIATAATLFGVLKYFNSAIDNAMLEHPDRDACQSLTEYVWRKKFKTNWMELQRLQKFFSEKI